jgi:hypothetical protein
MLKGFGDFGHFAPALGVIGIGLKAIGEDGLGAFVMAGVDERGGGRIGGAERQRKNGDRKKILDMRGDERITEIPR